jgi:hypothetical protein
VFGTRREEEKNLHKEELYNLYSLSVIIRIIKLWRLRWTGLVECMGE